jgi:hypothetical protein
MAGGVGTVVLGRDADQARGDDERAAALGQRVAERLDRAAVELGRLDICEKSWW